MSNENAKKAGARQLMGLFKPKSNDPENEALGRWQIEDCVTGPTGVSMEILAGGTCRLSNGVSGTWRVKEDGQLEIKAVPYAAFFVTPGGDEMLGAWMLIQGNVGIPSSVALHRIED
ncbi:MAG: hypothetical protein JXA21_10765 [Anaerolineae bacterium]|nr:hypothetical protein [Anaerolineae bacterium]